METPRSQEEDITAVSEMAIAERQERGVLQLRRRRRRPFVVATTTTVLACLSTVTTSLSHIVCTTLPFVAQQLQLASNYVSWRQVERLQLIYKYSCQAGDYYRSYYRTTLELHYNMTTTPKPEEVINVEETTAGTRVEEPTDTTSTRGTSSQGLEGCERLLGLYNFDYKEASRTIGAYYSMYNELRLPPTKESESESEEELQSMIQTHYLWSPFHYTHPGDNNPTRTYLGDNNPTRTYYCVVEDSELEKWEDYRKERLAAIRMEGYYIQGLPAPTSSRTPTTSSQQRTFDGPQLDVYYSCSCERKAPPHRCKSLSKDCLGEELASLLQERWFGLHGAGEPQRCTT